ncbi:cation:proton antiporter [Sedimenticola selenatireducens]|uniref:Portal protein n=1 Tax=Sedimenticola selenatireducens TaxID=191960 RepID=A0A2N6CSE9_9GAMM|nr:cation:proton antiporter [Sedimenticola selenatireducens]PLX59985.1 MAG: portal protein [Sedimenticola selenatireducens]
MHLDTFIFSALLLLAVTSVAVTLFRHLGLGSILGLLIAGVVVGPHSPGPYVTAHVEDVRHFTELGVVLLMFVIGLEMRPTRLWSMRRYLFGLGSLQILLVGLAITLYVSIGVKSWQTALLIGLTLSLSSTAFVMQLLQERGELASKHGSGTFAILLMQDLAVVPLLALVALLSNNTAISSSIPLWQQLLILAGIFAVLWIFGLKIVPMALEWLARHDNREAFLLVVLLAVFFAAWMMHRAGLSMALGAFIMGMLLSGSSYNMQIRAFIEPYKGLLMSLFFVAVGMSIDLGALTERPLLFIGHTVVLISIKLFVLFPLAIAFGYSRGEATRITFLLAQAGEFGFVLFGSALALKVIDEEIFIMSVAVISLSMMFTPLLIRLGDWLARYLEKSSHGSSAPSREGLELEERSVLIGGYGRVGHTVATLLQTSGIPFIAFDTNPAHVKRGTANGHPVLYGDISDPELLAAAHAERSSLVVLTIDHGPTVMRAVSHFRNTYPRIPVIARARDLEASGQLLKAGATQAFPEAIEASLRLGAEALKMVGASEDNVQLLMDGIRSGGYKMVQQEKKVNPSPGKVG